MPEQADANQGLRGDPEMLAILAGAAAAAGGALRFDTFMELALYHPEAGYYVRDRHRVGRGGDFVTSVSVGRCFGMLLARRLAPGLQKLAEGGGEVIVAEPGAEGGELAEDIMTELAGQVPPDAFAKLRYVAVEPISAKRDPLAERLRQGDVERFEIVGGWDEISGARGALVANEVLDAMPLRRFRLQGGEWREIYIECSSGGCREALREIGAGDDVAVGWPTEIEDGFTVEHCDGVWGWFDEVAAAFTEVEGVLIDYGLPLSAEFFDPGRRGGTLRAYAAHRLLDDPLSAPGLSDMTAHVDFERAGKVAEAAGFEVVDLSDQHHFLTRAARPWLLELDGKGVPDPATAKLLRQFQSLTHPAAMGATFKVLEVRKTNSARE